MLVGTLFSLGTRVRRAPAGGGGRVWPVPRGSAWVEHTHLAPPEALPPAHLHALSATLAVWQARRVYFTLPEALHRSQPGARQACFRHFRRSQVWDLTQPVEHLR